MVRNHPIKSTLLGVVYLAYKTGMDKDTHAKEMAGLQEKLQGEESMYALIIEAKS